MRKLTFIAVLVLAVVALVGVAASVSAGAPTGANPTVLFVIKGKFGPYTAAAGPTSGMIASTQGDSS